MFTGIVCGVGEVREVRSLERGKEFSIRALEIVPRLEPGSSVAVNGTCLTVVARDGESFRTQVVMETLRVTNLGELAAGETVNLEPSLRVGDELGGHLVQGHVDGQAEVIGIHEGDMDRRVDFRIDPELGHYLVPKGSVSLDGVSLTLGPEVTPELFHVFVIPHTWEKTIVRRYVPGTRVNVEVDILSKYVRHFLDGEGRPPRPLGGG